MSDQDELNSGLPLGGAIRALREELLEAWRNSSDAQLRFRPAPVELTLNVGVTRGGTAKAGVKWWLIESGGERSRQAVVTQTIKLVLEPVLIDAAGNETEFFVSDSDEPVGLDGGGDDAALDDEG
jgi:hypothetical protein